MNTLDIVLVNIICYMGGLFSGLGIFLKYKQAVLVRTSSHSQLKDLVRNLTNDLQGIQTSSGPPLTPPLIPSAPVLYPSQPEYKEVVIRTT
jgi:hypothetical protein